ncbi:translation initiation factor eIF-2B subunit family protein [Aspergillus foveolatus]|uniref:translation initiation factor eIF-2B subunit family protein n=1 Tax=Aspergillus foveolatus TaxID=210207 RepID=UPI003CCD37DB
MAGQISGVGQGLERRSVVSSFVFHFPTYLSDQPLVALFKRSDKVNTYKNHIAPISGTISRNDKDALTAAWRELSEETGINPSSATFWRTGKPFSFVDESINREWTIYPFAFQLKGTAVGSRRDSAVELDWEHEGWEWYNPTDVLTGNGLHGKGKEVPHLRESLRRVWPEGELNSKAGKALRRGLEKLQNDHESGSHELTSIALGVFRDVVKHMPNGMGGAKWWEDVQMIAWHIVKNGRESMGAATLNALLAILEEMEEIWRLETGRIDFDAGWKLERMLTIIDHHLKSRMSRAGLVKDMFAAYVRDHFLPDGKSRDKLTILTLSASSTIRDSIIEAFASLETATLELRVLESRPLFEGVSISSSILSKFKTQCKEPSKHLHITIYTDASAAIAAKDVDMVLLGADRISVSKGVSNKTGSLPAVLCAKHVSPKVKIVVLSELEKVNGSYGVIDDTKHEDNDPAELIRPWQNEGVKGLRTIEEGFHSAVRVEKSNHCVEVRNVYFEWIPLDMVDGFVSGEGVLNHWSISEKAKQQDELAKRYFGSISLRY